MKLRGKANEDLPFRCLTMSIAFELTRNDVFEIIGKDIILETDPDMDEESWIDQAEKQIAQKWTGKGNFEKTLRRILYTDGTSHNWDDYSLKEEDIRLHRPLCTVLIDEVINKHLPSFELTEREIESFKEWKSSIEKEPR